MAMPPQTQPNKEPPAPPQSVKPPVQKPTTFYVPPIAQLIAILMVIVMTGFLGYSVGYRDGSLTLHTPPTLRVLNAGSTGVPALAIDDPGKKVDFGDFWKAWYILEKNYAPGTSTPPQASTTELRVAGAIAGLAASYGDPYTVFIPKKEADAFKESVNAEFEGIGAVLDLDNGTVKVKAILKGSPADHAGLKPDTTITAVNDASVANQALEDVIPRIRGPKGTDVVLTIVAPGATVEEKLSITRGTIAIPTTATRVISASKAVVAAAVEKAKAAKQALTGAVSSALEAEEEQEVAEQHFFVLQLAAFAKTSIDAFVSDLKKFADSDTQYLIIDLRNNPGGYLGVAVDLASYFLPKDALVVSDRAGADSKTTEYRSVGHDTLEKLTGRRIVVLVNKHSASASEILAGALQDHGIAKVVGETSFGKGSVQTLIDVSDIGTIKVTISRWYTPKGNNISERGIEPDVKVDISDPKYASSTDPFMDAATEVLLDDSVWEAQKPLQ